MDRKQMEIAFFKYSQIMKERTGLNQHSVYIVGSQAIWSKHNALSPILKQSKEIDIIPEYFSQELDDHIEFVTGEETDFHNENDFYIDIVEESTIKAPLNWKERTLKEVYPSKQKSKQEKELGFKLNIQFISPEDLLLSKMIAGREKDFLFVEEMFKIQIVSVKKINKILNNNELDHHLNQETATLLINRLNRYSNTYSNPRKQIRYNIDHLKNSDFEMPNGFKKQSSNGNSIKNKFTK